MSNWLVFLEIDSGFERAYTAAQELGFKVALYVSEERMAESAPADTVIIGALMFKQIAECVSELGISVAGFWALKDKLIPLVAKLNKEFVRNKTSYSNEVVRLTKDKIAMRSALNGSVFNPRYEVHHLRTLSRRPLPGHAVVIKPPLGYASIGVEKVMPENDFFAALDRCASVRTTIVESISDFDSSGTADLILVEEFIEGQEFSAEVFATRGKIECLGICAKSEMKPPYFEEISYCFPANIPETLANRLRSAAIEVMSRLGLSSGMAHLEFRVRGDEIIVLDIGLRLGGSGLTHDLVHYASGIDLVKAVLAELTGLDPLPFLKPTRSDIGLLYLIQVGTGGQVRKLADATADRYPEKLRSRHFVSPGDRLNGYPAYSGLPGFILFHIKGQTSASYQRVDEVLASAALDYAIEYEA